MSHLAFTLNGELFVHSIPKLIVIDDHINRDKVKVLTSGVRCQTAKGYPTFDDALTVFTRAMIDNKVFARNQLQAPSARLSTSTPISNESSTSNIIYDRAIVPLHQWYLDLANADPIPEGPRWIVLFQAADVGVFDDGEHKLAAGAIMNVKGAIWRVYSDMDIAYRAFEDALTDGIVDIAVIGEWETES